MIDKKPDLNIENVTRNGQHIAIIIRSDYLPFKTNFVTPEHYYQQTGFVVYPKEGIIKRHSHLPLKRYPLPGWHKGSAARPQRLFRDRALCH
jgi:hypothetical protein